MILIIYNNTLLVRIVKENNHFQDKDDHQMRKVMINVIGFKSPIWDRRSRAMRSVIDGDLYVRVSCGNY